jgi:putative pyruvate formate lyase activating enzyme
MLDRYFAVERHERFAMHWLARLTEAGVDHLPGASDEELFAANTAGIRELLATRDSAADIFREESASSILDVKIELAHRMLSDCRFCSRCCGADRTSGETGYCGVGANSHYNSDFLHMGEEPELVPSHTIFFSGCTFHCVYCQNWDIAFSAGSGPAAEPAVLAAALQEGIAQGSRNANFVGGNPDPNLHVILETMRKLGHPGRFLPMVWNSNMYTSPEAMEILNGVIDVYLGDFRYGNDDCARELSDVEGYFDVVSRNFSHAWDTAEVMVRHLVLPGHLECCTRPIMEWTRENMPGAYFNLMFQYRPEYRAGLFPQIDRRLTDREKWAAIAMAEEYELSKR